MDVNLHSLDICLILTSNCLLWDTGWDALKFDNNFQRDLHKDFSNMTYPPTIMYLFRNGIEKFSECCVYHAIKFKTLQFGVCPMPLVKSSELHFFGGLFSIIIII